MFATFNLTLTTSYQSIWNAIIASGYMDTTGTVLNAGNRTNQILADRGNMLDLRPGDANTGTVTLTDKQLGAGAALTNMSKRSSRNSICYKDYYVKGSDNTQVLVVEVESV